MNRINWISPLALAGLLSAASPAIADQDRWYLAGNIGLGNLSSTTLSYDDGSTSESDDVSFDASFVGGATIGYRISDRFSVEGDLMYRRNEFDGAQLGSFGTFSGGDFASLGIGINALYRFSVGTSGKLSGYIGPGYVYLQEIDIDFDNGGQQEISFETDDSGLQLKFGGRYDFSDRWFMEAGATYFDGGSIRMEIPSDADQGLTADYQHWSFSLGAGLRF
jgi:outer membrane protein W